MKSIRYALAALVLAASAVFFVHCDRSESSGEMRADWTESAADWGLDAHYPTAAAGAFRMPEIMGGGVALVDIDGDQDLDLFLCGGAGENRLYENRDQRFHEVAFPSKGEQRFSMGVATGDVDNDGDIDLWVSNLGEDQLFINDGHGSFSDGTVGSGIRIDGWSTSATFFDANGDGWLDLFVGRYVRHNESKRCTDASGRRDYCGPSVFAPESDSFWLNGGDGRFVDATDRLGFGRGIGAALGVVSLDANGDRRPDLFVANDGDPNHLWIQQADGSFSDEALLRGVAYNHAGEAEAGMGVVAAQLTSASALDLFVTHLAEETHTLYESSTRRFKDVSGERQLADPSRASTGFGVVAIDEEFDGDLDLWVANGRVAGGPIEERLTLRYAEPNHRFIQDGATQRFESREMGDVAPQVSRGMTAGDVDNDGDDDVIIVNLDAAVELWINESPRKGSWIAIEAWLPEQNRSAVGAVVELWTSRGVRLAQIDSGSSYLSAKPAVARFGLGDAELSSIRVQWPDGLRERFSEFTLNQTHRFQRGQGEPE